MTENETIERIKHRMHTVEQVAGENGMEDLEMAIKALEEVQQYRAIGTPEELQEMKKDFAEALSDWRQYRKVGTLEECRAAVEKQTARKVTTNHSWTHYHFFCPVCNMEVNDMKYCLNCGQKMKWEDEK